jgi:rhodanese-related sulfurtransferase
MKKLNYLMILTLVLGSLMFSSCEKDKDEPKINESEVLVNYLESTASPSGKDFVNTDMPTIIPATDVHALNLTGQIYIIDIRSAADFQNGHIENAVNVPLAQLLDHVKNINMSNYEKVAVVCYSGQSASYGASLLRLLGYNKVFAMKWGMCGWHSDFAGGWNNAIANGNAFAAQFTNVATEKAPAGQLPVLNTGKTTGQEILEARVTALLTEGYGAGVASVTNQVVFDNLAGYYIVNYWPAAQYNDPGHIPGATQYTPKEDMKMSTNLKTLPTDKPLVLYCYTGQTSSFLAAYLRILGYDAKSLLYGANAMIYDKMVEKQMTTFSANEIKGYDYEKP